MRNGYQTKVPTTNKITSRIIELIAGLTIQVTNGNGMYHICIKECGIGDKPALNQNAVIKGKTKPLIHSGIIKYGFYTTVPKITGSLMLNIDGAIHALPKAFILRDLHANNISKTKGRVHPTPPIHGKL